MLPTNAPAVGPEVAVGPDVAVGPEVAAGPEVARQSLEVLNM